MIDRCKVKYPFSNPGVFSQLLDFLFIFLSQFVSRKEVLLLGYIISFNYCSKDWKTIFCIQRQVKIICINSSDFLSYIKVDKESELGLLPQERLHFNDSNIQFLLQVEHNLSDHSIISLPCILEVVQLGQFLDFLGE